MDLLRPATHEDFEFLWNLHQKTMRKYVDETWGWDDAIQEKFFRDNFVPEDFKVVMVEGQSIGCMRFQWQLRELVLETIQISPEHQRSGLGTELIQDILKNASEHRRDVSTRVLHCNPAKELFFRLGFVEIGKTDTHLRLAWSPRKRST